MKPYGGVEVEIFAFLTLALDVGEWSFTPATALDSGKIWK